jgi:hypothetical protein
MWEAHAKDYTNVCLISGYVERHPAIRYREDGIAQCTWTLRVEELGATGTIYKTYVMAEAFGKTGEALGELHSDTLAMLQGKLFWRKHLTKSGEEKRGLALLVQKVSVLTPAPVEVH